MKYSIKTVLLLTLTAVMLFNANLSAQKRQYPEFHYLSLPISVGYSNYYAPGFKKEFPEYKNPGLVGATIGIGYEYRYRLFWMSMHLEGQLLTSRLRPGIAQVDTIMIDTDSHYEQARRENNYHYKFSSWRDDQLGVYGCFPIMFGLKVNAFYFGVGAKVGYCFYGTSTPKATYVTSATYERYIADFENMPNHFLTEYQSGLTNKGTDININYNLNVAAIAEIGYEVYHSEGSKTVRPWILKLGAYAEYGFLNAYNNNGRVESQMEMKQVSVDEGDEPVRDPSQLELRPFYKSHSTKNIAINPLYVGAKLTFLFELPVPQKCHCLQNERGASWRNLAPKETKKQNKAAKKKVRKQKKIMGDDGTNSNLNGGGGPK